VNKTSLISKNVSDYKHSYMILKPIHELSHQTVGVVFASCHQCGNILMSSSMGIKFELLLCTLPT